MTFTAMPEMKPEERLSVEEMHEDTSKANVQQKGGTRQDEREMVRMGKHQELRVSSRACLTMICLLISLAQFQVCRYCGLRHNTPEHVGVHTYSELLRSPERRHCGRNMVHHRGMALHAVHDSFNGRDGQYGSNSWWTVSLGESRRTPSMQRCC